MGGAKRYVVACCAVFGLAGQGCGTSKAIGLTDASFTPKHEVALVCLQKRDGRSTTLIEGETDGRPAVSVHGVVIGYSAVLNEPVDVQGMQVFAGQRCSYGGVMGPHPICESATVTRNGERRVLLYATRFLPSPDLVPTTMQGVIDDLNARKVFDTVKQIDLDADAFAALSDLSKTRGTAATVHATVMVAGAVATGAGEVAQSSKGSKEVKKVGKEATKVGQDLLGAGDTFAVDPDDKPYVDRYPKLAPVFEMLSEATVVCVSGG